jgi:hypothetical protein
MFHVSECGIFFTTPNYEEVNNMKNHKGECTFCFRPSILRDESLGVEYCEFHAKVLFDVVEKETKE